ncbi:MAG: DUF924 family protein [Acidiferrobacterales bacterium]
MTYWFRPDAEIGECLRFWFRADPAVDAEIGSRFGALIEAASVARLAEWEAAPRGRLALILLLDQFRRNVYRDTRAAFSLDGAALALCRSGMKQRMDRTLSLLERAFFYMPLQHAENMTAQTASIAAFRRLADESSEEVRPSMGELLASAETHHNLIARFGRFPHRNAILKRECTPAEAAYLLSERAPFNK